MQVIQFQSLVWELWPQICAKKKKKAIMHFCRQCWQAKRDSIGWYLVEGRVWASQVALVVKNPANAGDIRDMSSIPGLGRSPGGGHGNPLQYSCLENPMARGAWQSIESQKSWVWLRQLGTQHTNILLSPYIFSIITIHIKWPALRYESLNQE